MRFVKRNMNDDLAENNYCKSLLANSKIKKDDLHKDDRIRAYLVKQYGLKCCYCENVLDSSTQVQVDHFYPQRVAKKKRNRKKYVYDVQNFHISCWRCNHFKGMFDGDPTHRKYYKGPAPSPNYYQDGGVWKLSKKSHLEKHIKYRGPILKTDKYTLFFDRLKINIKSRGEKLGTHLSAVLDRTRYFNETQELLSLCDDLVRYDKDIAGRFLKFLSKRFNKKAKYSTMIIQNFGTAYLDLKHRIEGKTP